MERLVQATKRVAGFKQTLKAVESNSAVLVYIAEDAEDKIRKPILELCKDKGIPIVEADSMNELGNINGIRIGTATAAILEQI